MLALVFIELPSLGNNNLLKRKSESRDSEDVVIIEASKHAKRVCLSCCVEAYLNNKIIASGRCSFLPIYQYTKFISSPVAETPMEGGPSVEEPSPAPEPQPEK